MRFLLSALFAVSLVATSQSANAQASKHPATAEDLLAFEAIGRSAFDNRARYIVWEQAPPYSTLVDYSTPSAPPMDSGGFALWLHDRQHPERAAERLVIPGSPSGLWIGSFSPDGRNLAFFGRMDGALRVGVFEIATRKARWFKTLPAGSFRTSRPEFAWIDNDRLGILALTSGPSAARQNYNPGAYGDAMHNAWQAAAAGKTITATEAVSPLASMDNGAPRRFVVLDLRDSSERPVAAGRFEEMALSPDNKQIALVSTDALGESTDFTIVSANDLQVSEQVSARSERGHIIEEWRSRQRAELRASARGIQTKAPEPDAGAPDANMTLLDRDGARDLAIEAKGGAPKPLAHIDARMRNVVRGSWRFVEYDVEVGGTVSHLRSAAVLPPDYQPGRRYPVIVYIYPGAQQDDFANWLTGPPDTAGLALDSSGLTLLSAHGYIIYYVSNPAALVNTGGGALQHMPQLAAAGLKALVDQGFADPERIGLFGFSQGGYSALWLAVNPGPYRAIVSANSWADPAMQSFDLHGYYRKLFPTDLLPLSKNPTRFESKGAFLIGKTPFEDAEAYIRASPVFHADRVQAPILLMHSDFDEFAIDQYERFFTALLRLNKPAKLIRYLGEAHGNTSPANLRHQWANMFAWYDRYLDVGRNDTGSIAWDGDKVRGWEGRKPFDAEHYYGLARIFGKPPSARVSGSR